jgi:nucleotide-binding universal stress UspA family protein
MTERAKRSEPAATGSAPEPAATGSASKRFRSVLVPVDLTPYSDRVVGRVALLPLAEDARVTLLHVVPGSLPLADERRARRDASKALEDEARHLRKSLSVDIETIVEVGAAARKIAASANAVKAELIVMGRGSRRAFREVFLGSTAERVVRQGKLPVLVVRLPGRAAYARPALALDLDRAAHPVLRLMLRMLPPPRPRVTIIHALDEPYRSYAYHSLSGEAAERDAARQLHASARLRRLLAKALARSGALPRDVPVARTVVRHGAPQIVIENAVQQAATDLLVLGTRARTGVAHALLGTVAGDVLRNVACDVLVVPPRPSGK